MNKKSKLGRGKSTLKSLQSLQQLQNHQIILNKLNDNLGINLRFKSMKKYNRKKLTRAEMWDAITSKYPSLSCFTINRVRAETPFFYHINREELFNIIMEMKIHKSRHLNKKQKQKVEYEINEKIADKI